MQLAKITKPVWEAFESRHPSSVIEASLNVAISLLYSYVKNAYAKSQCVSLLLVQV